MIPELEVSLSRLPSFGCRVTEVRRGDADDKIFSSTNKSQLYRIMVYWFAIPCTGDLKVLEYFIFACTNLLCKA